MNKNKVKEIYYNSYSDELQHSYWNNFVWFELDYINNSKTKINELLNSNNKLDSKDIIYTSQASDIPRFKLKEFITEKGIKRTTRIQQSTCILLSKKILLDILGNNELKESKTVYFLNEEFVNIVFKTIKRSEELFKDKPKDLNKWLYIPEEYVNKGTNKSLLKYSKKYSSFINTHLIKDEGYRVYRNNKMIDVLEIINFIYNNPNIKVVFDEDLISDLNKEGVQLDNEIENTLKDMIYSKDAANIKLGLEMLSNLEINDYTLYKISLMLNNFVNMGNNSNTRRNRGIINQLTMNNRNLKTLLNTFRSKEIYWDKDWKQFAGGLVKNFTNTEHESLIKEYFIDRLNNEFKSLSGIKIEDIKFA